MDPPLFACVVPGCPVVTSFTQFEPNKWSAPLGNAPESIVVFLTGASPVPDGFGLGLYVACIDDGTGGSAAGTAGFEFVGRIDNQCPSRVVKVPLSIMRIDRPTPISLGIALEPLDTLQNVEGCTSSVLEQSRAATYLHIATKITQQLYTFLMSHAQTLSADPSDPQSVEMVYLPATWVDKWRERLERYMAKDASFWS